MTGLRENGLRLRGRPLVFRNNVAERWALSYESLDVAMPAPRRSFDFVGRLAVATGPFWRGKGILPMVRHGREARATTTILPTVYSSMQFLLLVPFEAHDWSL